MIHSYAMQGRRLPGQSKVAIIFFCCIVLTFAFGLRRYHISSSSVVQRSAQSRPVDGAGTCVGRYKRWWRGSQQPPTDLPTASNAVFVTFALHKISHAAQNSIQPSNIDGLLKSIHQSQIFSSSSHWRSTREAEHSENDGILKS